MSRGFALIQMSVLLTVASLTLVVCLPQTPSQQVYASRSAMQMNKLMTALRQFEASHGRLPCPSDAGRQTGDTYYGIEASGGGASGNCSGSIPAANLIDATSHVAMGMVPVRTLGLPASAAIDAWGREISYAVDTQATSCFLGSLPGALTITDKNGGGHAAAALISYGPDGHGAWIPRTAAGTATRLNSGATDADELTNAHVTTAFATTLPLTGFVRKPPTKTFGDLVAYKNTRWNLATLPAAASPLFPALTPPANGIYIAGQTLSFSLTYPGNVTVSGLPRLTLTLGSSTRYAYYTSGSGTTTLSFTYTVQTGDYAPAGIAVANTLDVNGGTSSAPCNIFSLPTLTGVMVKNLYIYVTDSINNRVEEFSAAGAYIAKFGSGGSGNGQFLTPKQPVADAAGNIWVSDRLNGRVEGFSSGGTYIAQFGSLGIGNGQFTTAGAMAVDSGGNFWVADIGGNRIEKFSASRAYLAQFGSGGIANGQFISPMGVAIDGAGNIWVGDWGNSRLEKFSASGAYLAKFGSLGSGNGQFINPCGHAIDPSGNIYVADNGNSRIQKFDATGNYLGQFGSYGTASGKLINPCGIAIDLAGNVWVGDSGNNRIQEFSASGSYLGQFGSWGTGNGQMITPAGVGLAYQ